MAPMKPDAITTAQPGSLVRRGGLLQYATIAWNSAEAGIAIGAGLAAGSIALVGFGFDSAIEVTSSLAAVWLLSRYQDEERRNAVRRPRRSPCA
jgi:divalent metal cation (Fe/Co/Zn/Cd) transporter